MSTASMSVTIYNLGGIEPLGTVSVRKAVTMLHRGVARIHTEIENAKFGTYSVPAAVELIRYIFAKWKYDSEYRRYSKRNILERDKYICAYCGNHADTVDHINPRCLGGVSSWDNVVAACFKCNSKKGGRTPEQAGMKLRFRQ
ncbi:MAG: HNH endonuclease [Cetobacterium sp.]